MADMKLSASGRAVRIALFALVVWASGSSTPLTGQTTLSSPRNAPGQTATLLAGGSWLVVGGEGQEGRAAIWDSRRNTLTSTVGQPVTARAWHTATVLPDGTVLIVGGRSADGRVLASPELFDPNLQSFQTILSGELRPRAHHTATLLTDGRVLIVGGVAGTTISQSELWSMSTQTVQAAAPIRAPRADHIAVLEPDGRVRIEGGRDSSGNSGATEIYDPVQNRFFNGERGAPAGAVQPYVAETTPRDHAPDVSTDVRIVLRFSTAVDLQSVQSESVRLVGPNGPVETSRVPAESGRLLFLTPLASLEWNTKYTLEASQLVAIDGTPLPAHSSDFTTVPEHASTPDADAAADWTPGANGFDRWRIGRPPSSWQSMPPLRAPEGTTAVAGQVLAVEDVPLPNVQVAIGTTRTVTDRFGRFLLEAVEPGPGVLTITAHAAGVRGDDYGMYEIGVDARTETTTVLPFTMWLSRIDHARATALTGGAAQAVTTPRMPSVEVQIPAGVTLRNHHTGVLRRLTMTPLPADRPPVPLPPGTQPLAFFTVQTHGADVERAGGGEAPGVRIVYPNTLGLPRGARVDFWTYEATRGWIVYGQGSVSPDGRRVELDPGVRLRRVQCFQFAAAADAPAQGPRPGGGPADGEPVDLATGLFVYKKTDVVLPDVIPIALTRTYRPNDSTSRAFGIGTTHPYDMFLIGDVGDTWADLILPDGGRVHYVRTSPGTGHLTAVLEHTSTPTAFQKSEIRWNSSASRQSWDLTLRDGTVYEFGTKLTNNVRLVGIVNRHGQRLVIQRNGINISRIISPHGRILDFTADASNRITSMRDNLGREVTYEYDGSGRLWRVIDQGGGITEFTYDASHRMLTLKDQRGIVYLTNQYDGNGRVTHQTQADQTTYDFAYVLDGSGQVVQADVTDPRGFVRRVAFNGSRYWLTDTAAFGTPQAQTATAERQAGTNYMTARTDALARRTEYTYDTKGNVLTMTRLAGTGNAVTTTYTYQQQFSLLTSQTDPLGHTTSFGRDGKGNLISITDALNHQRTFTYSAAGLMLTSSDAAGTTQFGYDAADLISITDPLGGTTTRFVDAAGLLLAQTDPLGRQTQYTYTPQSLVASVRDARGAMTAFTYDGNGNLLTLTDALTHTTTYTYNSMDRMATRTDPLSRGESYVYDANGNVAQVTDRKNQVTAYTYDPLNRLMQTTYHDSSTTVHTYDAGDRLTQVADSLAGTITRVYDGLDRLTSETMPAGSIAYTYDSASRRATMTVNGQPQVTYGYDNADRLTSITQDSAIIGFSYDSADRRTVLTLPNGMTVEYGYDASSQITSLTYKLGLTTLGDLTYTYDQAGQRTSVGGMWARTGLPSALTSATYDAANQIIAFGGNPFAYDANGNLTSDGVRAYTWNARNELVALTGPLSGSFAYDGFGRRQSKTIGGSTTQFLYDGFNPVQELTGATPAANLMTGLNVDEFFTRTDGAGVRNFLTDALGSSVALTDGSGTVQTEYSYEPFGSLTINGATTTNTFTFTGREADGTGLYYYRARYYDRSTARFLSEDPLAERAGINFYSYVGNQPTLYIDPLGLAELCCRPVNMPGLRQVGAKHCFIKMSDGTTYGGYNRGGRLRPELNAPDDKCPNDPPDCTPLPGPEDDIRKAWNNLPKGDRTYGVDGSSNRIPADVLDGAGIPYTMPPGAWGTRPLQNVIPIPSTPYNPRR